MRNCQVRLITLVVRIVNVVATANLNQPIDIEAAGQFKDFLHDSEIYGGRVVYYQNNEMDGKVTIFPSGKMISVGAKTIKNAFSNFSMTARALAENKLSQPIVTDETIRNIVAITDVGREIDLELLSLKHRLIYEPEQFPGAIIRLEDPIVTVLLFRSGKAVIAGAKSLKALQDGGKQIAKLVDS